MFYHCSTQGRKDWFDGIVQSVTMQNKYDIAYDHNDSQEMGEKNFEKYDLDIDKQAVAHLAQLHGDRLRKNCFDCNCSRANYYHPWAKETAEFNPETYPVGSTADFRMEGSRKRKTSSCIPPVDIDFYAAISFSHQKPNAVNVSDEIQGMDSHATMSSKRHKTNSKMSAYALDPISVEECKKSEDWSASQQGIFWKQAIISEIDNMLKFKVLNIISLSIVPFGSKIFPIILAALLLIYKRNLRNLYTLVPQNA